MCLSSINQLLKLKAKSLSENKELSLDEQLICSFFSQKILSMYKVLKKPEYENTFLNAYYQENRRYNTYSYPSISFSAGGFFPVGYNEVFRYSPIIGFAISSGIERKFFYSIIFKYKFDLNDKTYEYFAKGKTNTVNSSSSYFSALGANYKLYENTQFILSTKLEAGLNSMNTKIVEYKTNPVDTISHKIRPIYFSLGISGMTAVLKKHYLGIDILWYYIPYERNKKLITPIPPNYLTAELFYRF